MDINVLTIIIVIIAINYNSLEWFNCKKWSSKYNFNKKWSSKYNFNKK